MSYPIKDNLDKAHDLLACAAAFLVFQIVAKKYRPADTRESLRKATEAVEVLKNLIDQAPQKG